MGGRHGKILAGAALLCLALPASVGARTDAAPAASWTGPTPAEGRVFTVGVGNQLAFSLAAVAPGAPLVNVSITHQGLPANAVFRQTTGNPATGDFSFTPTSAQA